MRRMISERNAIGAKICLTQGCLACTRIAVEEVPIVGDQHQQIVNLSFQW